MEVKDFKLAVMPVVISLVGVLMLAITLFATRQSGANLVSLSRALINPHLSLSSSGKTLVSSVKVNGNDNQSKVSISQSIGESISNQLMLDQIRSSAINYQPSTSKS